MEIAEVKKVKLNVTNIKSVLIRSNKKLRNVEKQKSYLIRRQEEQEKRIVLEKKIETPIKKLKIPLLGKAVGVARSIWDRLVNFFGYLLVGFVITRLPQIVENLKRRLAFIKPIWEGAMKTFAIIGKGMSTLFTGMVTLYNLRQSINRLGGLESDLGNINRELKGMKGELGGNASETGEESSTQEDTNNNESSSVNNMGNKNQTQVSGENEVGTMVQNLKKENNKITTKSKKIKEKNTRDRINPRLDSKSDRNFRVKRKTSPVVLNQKGPLERDMDIPNPNIVIAEKTQVKRVWWNPLTYFRGGSKGSTSSGSDNTGIMDQG
tara:strand:+ start:1305 stop:2270 length:966 start_codon:yes stop_codon:yes gene_type:complete